MSTVSKTFDNARVGSASNSAQAPCTGPSKPRGSLNSADILQGQTAVEINHNGATYRLQATRLGKLILTK